MRTGRILKRAGISSNLRFSEADRAFMRDLSRTGILSEAMASTHHYEQRKNGSQKPLSRFVSSGILERFSIHTPDGRRIVSYRFADDRTAKAFGGRYVSSTSSRSDYHELLTAEAYFKLDKPEDFKIALQFSEQDKREILGLNASVGILVNHKTRILPDAIATVNGEAVYIESDAGHYTKKQILDKMNAWGNRPQFWFQSATAKTRVPEAAHIQSLRVSL